MCCDSRKQQPQSWCHGNARDMIGGKGGKVAYEHTSYSSNIKLDPYEFVDDSTQLTQSKLIPMSNQRK